MTVNDVKNAVVRIAGLTKDPEAAYAEESKLHRNVLAAIAAGTCDDPKACAAEALTTTALDFPRWSA